MIRVGDVASAAVGIFAGVIAWALVALALRAAGFGSYALTTALPVAMGATAVVAPVLLIWTRSRAPQHFRQRFGVLFGASGFLLYASAAVVLLVPETIMFLA
ncbi:hypothetical protein [Mycobacterium sp. 236(2023)]|uniref:hypothetical protein n=1 Tax=Mycobacterium sp. 236(2023) TaxID=3038163 RepID=UPI00241517A5|nr:hypothetical protein [Mycobacterium sp. 236(2023)]MDG4669198.1 hypothetical protein [Mycobacterium sp. 236(2023)]